MRAAEQQQQRVSRAEARRRVVGLLRATALLGALALPVVGLFSEPYPWLLMPGFYGTGGFDGETVRMNEPVFSFELSPGGLLELSAPQLFAGVSPSYLRKLSGRFKAQPSKVPILDALIPSWLFPGFGHARLTPLDPHDPALFGWFRERLRAFYPEAEPVAVTVRYRERIVDAQGAQTLAPTAEPSRRFSP